MMRHLHYCTTAKACDTGRFATRWGADDILRCAYEAFRRWNSFRHDDDRKIIGHAFTLLSLMVIHIRRARDGI